MKPRKRRAPSATDPSHDVLFYRSHPFNAFFHPQSVAVVGATDREGSVGRTLVANLTSGSFKGAVYPVNPNRKDLFGLPCFPSVASLPSPVDLALIATPAATVPPVISECIGRGVKGAIVISAGFKETGTGGAELEQQILTQLRQSKMRLIGPNCLGLMNPVTGLNATFARTMARPGNVAFISQSGALCTAILDWSLKELFGFSAFISIGSMLDVGWGDLIDYLGNDANTHSIIIYMESIGNARAFLSAAREVALSKPIIVLKAGRTQAAAKAASSHTGTLTGSDEVLDVAFRRCGALRVDNIADLFYMAEVLSRQPRPRGPRLAILTNAGGAGVLATDALIADGGELAELSRKTTQELNEFLPSHWSHGNPVDILGDASPERFAHAMEVAGRDPSNDGLVLILTPQAMTDPVETARKVSQVKIPAKPVVASWMGGVDVLEGRALLNEANVPNFPHPESAVRAFNYMWKYHRNLQSLYETPELPADEDEHAPERQAARGVIENARSQGRALLDEVESKQVLNAYGIPAVKTFWASHEDEAEQHAGRIGYPVVLKLFSKTITHKTDVGGVSLNLTDAAAVREAFQKIRSNVLKHAGPDAFQGVTVQPMIRLEGYELIMGSSLDAQFGPVLLFGSGGQLVEVYRDRSLALPPLNSTLALRMMERTKIFRALRGVRGRKAVDLAELERILVRFSMLVVEQRWIKEIDINPLMACADTILALDARIILHEPELTEERIPRLAIRPYPLHYVSRWTMKDKTTVTFRPIRPEDEPLLVQFHRTLSERSVYLRFFEILRLDQRIAHERLIRRCFIDYDREMALVAEIKAGSDDHSIVAVGRLSKLGESDEAEFAILVSDQYQNKGLGAELLERLIQIGRSENILVISATILPDNRPMQKICEKLGFKLELAPGDSVVTARLNFA